MDSHQSTNTKRPATTDLHRDTHEMELKFAGLETEDRLNDQAKSYPQEKKMDQSYPGPKHDDQVTNTAGELESTVMVNAGNSSSTGTEGEVEMFKNMLKERMKELEEVRNRHFLEHSGYHHPDHKRPGPGDQYYVVLRTGYYPVEEGAALRERLFLPLRERERVSLPIKNCWRLWLYPRQEYAPDLQVLLRGLDDFKIFPDDDKVQHNISVLLSNPSHNQVRPYLLIPTSITPTISRALTRALQGRTDTIILSHCCSLHTNGRDCELVENLIRQLFFSPALRHLKHLFENPEPETE
jgi:hypothetical protein